MSRWSDGAPARDAYPPPNWSTDVLLDDAEAQQLARVLQSARQVQRRHQFFVWAQQQLQLVLPHQVLVCGAYQRSTRALQFDVLNNVVLDEPLMAVFSDPASPWMAALQQRWVEGRGWPLRLMLDELVRPCEADTALPHTPASQQLLVHGVARPQRRHELESLFVLVGPPHTRPWPRGEVWLGLLLPYLHSTWLRVQGNEGDLARPGRSAPVAPPSPASPHAAPITEREVQILRWVQQGKSNQQIAEQLAISPLTVKNHVQKILRKLEASNRTQAVARAIALGALPSGWMGLDPPDTAPNTPTPPSATT